MPSWFQGLIGGVEAFLHIGNNQPKQIAIAESDIAVAVEVGQNLAAALQQFVTVLQAFLAPYPAAAGVIGILTAALSAVQGVVGIIKGFETSPTAAPLLPTPASAVPLPQALPLTSEPPVTSG